MLWVEAFGGLCSRAAAERYKVRGRFLCARPTYAHGGASFIGAPLSTAVNERRCRLTTMRNHSLAFDGKPNPSIRIVTAPPRSSPTLSPLSTSDQPRERAFNKASHTSHAPAQRSACLTRSNRGSKTTHLILLITTVPK
jgi:hypothetical protein